MLAISSNPFHLLLYLKLIKLCEENQLMNVIEAGYSCLFLYRVGDKRNADSRRKEKRSSEEQ